MQTRTRLVIIGNGMVGHKLIETLVASAAEVLIEKKIDPGHALTL